MRGETPYWVIDQVSGDVLSSGTLSPLEEPVVNQENILSVDYIDGIKKVDLIDDSYQEFPDQGFTGRHQNGDGQVVPPKVFIIERGEFNPTTMKISGLDGYV